MQFEPTALDCCPMCCPMSDRRKMCIAIVLVAAACAGGPARRAPRPGPDELRELQKAERLYRARDPAFAALRDRLAARPATAYWLTAMFITYVIQAREARRADEEQFLRAAIGKPDPVETRAFEQLRALGAAAVPCVVENLLRHRFADRRRLGVEILGAIGEAALESLQPLLADRDPRLRRYAVEAVASMQPTPATERALLEASRDEEFTVRVAALHGLERRARTHAARLRAMLIHDPDPFVRQVAAQALGAVRDRETARALVSYYERALEEGDGRGVEAADASLRRISGRKQRANLATWRAWLASWEPREEQRR